MKVIPVLLVALTLCFATAHSQSAKTLKKLAKAEKLSKKGKLDKAEVILEDLLAEFPTYGRAWDQLSDLKHEQYLLAKSTLSFFGSAITITTTDKEGNIIEDDSLTMAFTSLFNKIRPGSMELEAYKHTLRLATLNTPTAVESAINLRTGYIDPKLDTGLSEAAQEHFYAGELAFRNSDFNTAAIEYQKAIDEEPEYFKAALYLGDAYYFQKLYLEAIKKFAAARDRFPELLEPRKYLMDAYMKEGLFEKALEAGIESMLVYPDYTMLQRIEDVAYEVNGAKLTMAYTQRMVLPNAVSKPGLSSNQPLPVASGHWIHYQEALHRMNEYCDSNGIITKENDETNASYLEVYSWEYMLSKSNDPSLEQARNMANKGYLDCYVLISNFHFDFYEQYKHFSTKNPDHIREYFELLLATE